MVSKRWVFGVWVGWLLCGCGESQYLPTRQDRTLGGVKEGAPLGRAVADPGILAEPGTYQPTKVAGSSEAVPFTRRTGPAAAQRGESGGGTDVQVKAAVRDLVNALQDGEVELALRSFDPEQVQRLMDKVDTLLNTFEKIDLLRRFLEKKLQVDESQAEQLLAALHGGEAELKWDILDAEHASISPNFSALLFGPKATPTLQLARQAGDWRFQLAAPLSAEDVDVIVAFHTQLQRDLDAVIDWVATAETVDTAQLSTLLTKALQGQPIEPGSEKATAAQPQAKPGEEKDAGEKKEEPPPRPKGKGQRVRPAGP